MTSVTPEQRVRWPALTVGAWAKQAFIHWACEPDTVQALLPDGLVPDLYEGRAWVSLTPFVMERVRALGTVALPKGSTFPETNLRTYVRGPDGKDGLWFFSLVVPNEAMTVMGRVPGVPYHIGRARVEEEEGGWIRYEGALRDGKAYYRVRVRPGAPIQASSLDVWLTGRWRAYSVRLGQLWETLVAHEPWPLQEAVIEDLREDMTTSTVPLPSAPSTPLVHYAQAARQVRFAAPRPVRAGRRVAVTF